LLPLISLWGKGDIFYGELMLANLNPEPDHAKPAKASKAFSYFSSYRLVCRTTTIQTPITENAFDAFASLRRKRGEKRCGCRGGDDGMANRQEGQKTYRYRLEPKSLARLKAIVQARKAQGQRQFGGRLFGCPEPQNPFDEGADGDN
jgi:hypothetical protein